MKRRVKWRRRIGQGNQNPLILVPILAVVGDFAIGITGYDKGVAGAFDSLNCAV